MSSRVIPVDEYINRRTFPKRWETEHSRYDREQFELNKAGTRGKSSFAYFPANTENN